MEEARAVCGYADLEDDEFPFSGGDAFVGVSERCAEALGDAIGLDWDSFGDEPHAFVEVTTSAELVVGGVAVLVAYGNALEVAEHAPLADELDQVRSELGGEGGALPEEVWFAFVQKWVTVVRFSPGLDKTMTRSPDDGVVSVAELDELGIGPVSVALALIHESSHGFLPNHVPCSPTSEYTCDDDPTGAYGAGVIWGYNWLTCNRALLDLGTCITTETTIRNQCGHIAGRDAFTPCGYDVNYCL